MNQKEYDEMKSNYANNQICQQMDTANDEAHVLIGKGNTESAWHEYISLSDMFERRYDEMTQETIDKMIDTLDQIATDIKQAEDIAAEAAGWYQPTGMTPHENIGDALAAFPLDDETVSYHPAHGDDETGCAEEAYCDDNPIDYIGDFA